MQTQWHNEHAGQPSHMRCDECFRALPINPPGTLTAGYGRDRQDKIICYACCAKHDKATMLADGKIVLYLAKQDDGSWAVTNWPGSLSFPARGVRTMRHPWARHALIAYFTGPDGRTWSAKNIGDSQIAHCRRLAR